MKQSVFVITNMDCPTEEALIRKRLGAVPGIGELAFNLMERRLTVGHTLPDEQPILDALGEIGMQTGPAQSDTGALRDANQAPAVPTRTWRLMAVSGLAAIGAEILAWTGTSETAPVVVALALLSIATGGLGTLRKGWIALKTFTLNINFLMCIAVDRSDGDRPMARGGRGDFPLCLGGTDRDAVAGAGPQRHSRAHGDGARKPPACDWTAASGARWLRPRCKGQTVRVRPGERIPLDGVVSARREFGQPGADHRREHAGRENEGDPVFAGTVNEPAPSNTA
jgi:Cd2+/Zn2+-exporting ATPase